MDKYGRKHKQGSDIATEHNDEHKKSSYVCIYRKRTRDKCKQTD